MVKRKKLLPSITPLQFLVLSHLVEQDWLGMDIRDNIARQGHAISPPAFYQLMRRMEDARLVIGQVDTMAFAPIVYTITKRGKLEWEYTRKFYRG